MGTHQPHDVRRAQILQAAIEVCAEKGHHATRVDDIATRAGLSKGAVYHHFASRQEVFLGVIELITAQATSYITALEESGASAAETMGRTVDMLLSMGEESPGLVRGVFELFFVGVRDEEFRKRVRGYYDTLLEVSAMVIRRGIERGELSCDVDPEEAARVIVMGGDGLLLILHMLDQGHLSSASVRLMNDLLFRGMARVPRDSGDE